LALAAFAATMHKRLIHIKRHATTGAGGHSAHPAPILATTTRDTRRSGAMVQTWLWPWSGAQTPEASIGHGHAKTYPAVVKTPHPELSQAAR